MIYNICSLIIQLLIYWNQYSFRNAKPLIGQNVGYVQYNDFPFVVCIAGIDDEILEENVWCTGTLVTFLHILTSEHCIDDIEVEPYRIIIGSNDLYRGSSFYPAWWLSYDQWCKAINRTISPKHNDIAMIKLTGTVCPLVTITAQLSSIRDPSVLYGQQVVAVGWGKKNDNSLPSYLQAVNLTITPTQQCEDTIERLKGIKYNFDFRYICSAATPYALLRDGDSGGPLLYEGVLLAVNKATSPNLDQFHPEIQNIHVHLEFYREFIDNEILDVLSLPISI